jgi:hypothetical protein
MFTTDQKLDIVEIVAITPPLLEACLDNLGSDLTPEIESKVIAEIATWNAGAKEADAAFTPTNSNEGFNLKSQAATRRIARYIRLMLDIPPEYCANLSGTGTIEIGL